MILAWYAIPVALLAGLCFTLIHLDSRRWVRNHNRRGNLIADRAERVWEDIYWMLYRDTESAHAEHIHATRVIRHMDTVPATSHLKEVI